MALLSTFNALLLAFVFPFFLWHGDEGEETAQIELKTIEKPKKIHSLLNTADWLRSVSENLSFFQFSYCKTAPKAYPVYILQKKSISIGTNSVNTQTVALLGGLHYSICIKEMLTVCIPAGGTSYALSCHLRCCHRCSIGFTVGQVTVQATSRH